MLAETAGTEITRFNALKHGMLSRDNDQMLESNLHFLGTQWEKAKYDLPSREKIFINLGSVLIVDDLCNGDLFVEFD
jgi:hypothetical protein